MNSRPAIPLSLYSLMALQFTIGGAVVPFIGMLLKDRGLEYSQIARLFLGSSTTLLIFPFLWGMLADRYLSLNKLFALLNLNGIICLILLSFLGQYWSLALVFMLFFAAFQPSLTLINSLCFHHLKNPSLEFGKIRAWGSIGWIFPSLLIFGWLRWKQPDNLNFVLWLGAALSLAALISTFFLPPTHPKAQNSQETENSLPYWQAVRILLKTPDYRTLLVTSFLISASFSVMAFYSPPFMEEAGIPREAIGPSQCIGVVLEIFVFQYIGTIIRRWDYFFTMIVGCLALALRNYLYYTTKDPWILAFSYLLPGMTIAFYQIGSNIYANSLARPEVKSTAQTLLVLTGSGMGPMFGHWMTSKVTTLTHGKLEHAFLAASGLAGLAAILIFWRALKQSPSDVSSQKFS